MVVILAAVAASLGVLAPPAGAATGVRAAVFALGPDGAEVRTFLDAAPSLSQSHPDVLLTVDAVDTYRVHQWGLDAVGADRRLPGERGNGVVVAVIDSGVQADHPDLAHAVLPGWSAIDGDPHHDPLGHGTGVAGIIAAYEGNGVGISGVADGVSILPLKVVGGDGTAWASDVAEAIVQAVQRDADVINISLTTTADAPVLRAAIAHASSNGIPVVGSAGNLGQRGNPVTYPAVYEGVTAVAASMRSGQPAPFASSGTWVDLIAPGVGIVTTDAAGGYQLVDGGSFAAPLAAGAIALLMAEGAVAADAVHTVSATALDLGPAGPDDRHGTGLLDIGAALTAAPQRPIGVADPIQTAAQLSHASAGVGRATHAVLVSRTAWADALAATALAGIGNPILLVEDTLPQASAAALVRALPAGATVHLLGGEAAVPERVAADVAALGYVPNRIAGASRVHTAALAAAHVAGGGDRGPDTVLLASGSGWADAVAAGPVAARTGAPILLTDGARLSAAAAEVLRDLAPARVVVLGGESVVGEQVIADVRAVPGLTAERVHGADRRATALAVATTLGGGSAGATVIDGFDPDGWVAGLAAAPTGLSLLMADREGGLDPSAAAYLSRLGTPRVISAVAG